MNKANSLTAWFGSLDPRVLLWSRAWYGCASAGIHWPYQWVFHYGCVVLGCGCQHCRPNTGRPSVQKHRERAFNYRNSQFIHPCQSKKGVKETLRHEYIMGNGKNVLTLASHFLWVAVLQTVGGKERDVMVRKEYWLVWYSFIRHQWLTENLGEPLRLVNC